MNVISNESKEAVTTSENIGVSSAIAARRRRRWIVNTLRVLILVVLIGGWELTTRVGIVDPFFWGRPSGILAQLFTWVTQGTAQGPFNANGVFAAMVILAALSLLAEFLITALENRLIGWRPNIISDMAI